MILRDTIIAPRNRCLKSCLREQHELFELGGIFIYTPGLRFQTMLPFSLLSCLGALCVSS